MARKKKQKKGWLRVLLLFLFLPLVVWGAAFIIWFYWYDLTGWLRPDPARRAQPGVTSPRQRDEREETAPAKRPQERILDDDRKKLDEILKRRN